MATAYYRSYFHNKVPAAAGEEKEEEGGGVTNSKP